MNCSQANSQISITDATIRCGGSLASKQFTKKYVCYHSPFRKDSNPSYVIDIQTNRWFDYGCDYCYDESGNAKFRTVVDLYYVKSNFQKSVNEILAILEAEYGIRTHHNIQQISLFQNRKKLISKKSVPKKRLQLLEILPIQNKALFCYLRDRGINLEIAKKYLKQIHFRLGDIGRTQFTLGFKNDSNGFETRNSLLKGFVGENGKTITSLNIDNGNRVLVFEGFFDFLSFLTDYKLTDFSSPVIILNSVNLINRAKKPLLEKQFKQVIFMLDNDVAGAKTLFSFSIKLQLELPKCEIINKSVIYNGFNDYNEYLMDKKGLGK